MDAETIQWIIIALLIGSNILQKYQLKLVSRAVRTMNDKIKQLEKQD